jgi:hypothetical protein
MDTKPLLSKRKPRADAQKLRRKVRDLERRNQQLQSEVQRSKHTHPMTSSSSVENPVCASNRPNMQSLALEQKGVQLTRSLSPSRNRRAAEDSPGQHKFDSSLHRYRQHPRDGSLHAGIQQHSRQQHASILAQDPRTAGPPHRHGEVCTDVSSPQGKGGLDPAY